MKIQLNKQYSYTDMESFITSLAKYDGWLMIKQGLTLKQEIKERADQQDNASSTADIIVFSTLVIENNKDEKLDDKIREELHKTPEFMKYERYNNKNKKHEWSKVKINDLVSNFTELRNEFIKLQSIKNTISEHTLENFIADNFLYNVDFMYALNQRVFTAKQKVVKTLLGKETYKDFSLRPWQNETIQEILKANKFYNLLSLAPRAGKTITILELTLLLARLLNKKIVLLPASKNLASNESFNEDFKEHGYKAKNEFTVCTKGSLFVASSDKKAPLKVLIDKRIKELKLIISVNDIVILVTDEADIASHTENSIEFIEAIKSNFNVIKQIAMSGTGIFKASKIFKGIKDEEIFFKALNYTELLDYGVDELVRRKFYNVQYNIDNLLNDVKHLLKSEGNDLDNLSKTQQKSLEFTNINQSFNQVNAWNSLIRYTRSFIDGSSVKTLKLNYSKVVMIFTPFDTKKGLDGFSTEFQKQNPDLNVMPLHGDKTNNRKAQKDTINELNKMKKMGDNRQLVIFSMSMGSRSYSVPEIRRVLVMSDNEITSGIYQKFGRCLTYNYNKQYKEPIQTAEIIRISFSNLDLKSELFLVENEVAKNNDEGTKTKTSLQLTRNTFIDVNIIDDEDMCITEIGNNDTEVLNTIDKILKYTDNTGYWMKQLFNVDISVDDNLSKKVKNKKEKTKAFSLKVPELNTKGTHTGNHLIISNNSDKKTAVQEQALRVYIEILRVLPYVAFELFDVNTIDELLEKNWKGVIPSNVLNKQDLKNNLKAEELNNLVLQSFRNMLIDDSEYVIDKLEEFSALTI